jgi:O-antigen ligase
VPNRGAIGACITLWALGFAIWLPTPPLLTFASLCLAILVWGFVLAGATNISVPARSRSALLALLSVLAILVALAARWRPEQAAILAAAAGVLALGALNADARWLYALLAALALGALLNVPISVLQVTVPELALPGIGPPSLHGRAGGNLGQPNQLASLALLGMLALMALRQRVCVRNSWMMLVSTALGLCLALTQSRTGLLSLGLLLVWVAIDRRLTRPMRWMPVAALIGCLAGLAWLTLMPQQHGDSAAALQHHLGLSGDVSASRFAIWSNSVELIRAHPWTGVGWGNFSAAWSLTPFPDRRPIPLDNAHNLPLHLMVELGIPLALVLLGTLAWALWRVRAALTRGPQDQQQVARCLAMMLVVLGLHSLLEYPLWYAYFLLPACYVVGVLVRWAGEGSVHDAAGSPPPIPAGQAAARDALKACGVLVVLGCLYGAWDYARVVQAFTAFGPGLHRTLEQRVAEGRRSVLFGHLVDYGLVTNASSFEGLQSAFVRPRHRLVNPHFLRVYAQALHEWGDEPSARYVAQRLREFHDPRYVEFFAACDAAPPSAEPRPFQCTPPPAGLAYDDIP